MSNLIDAIEAGQLKTDIPDFKVGDTVRVHAKIIEGDKERIQVFEGAVISRANGGNRGTFTVRKIFYGVGGERIFPLHSRSEEHTSEIQSLAYLVCRLLL